jgi:uncharacterized repeat protein (TIGR01451 family)
MTRSLLRGLLLAPAFLLISAVFAFAQGQFVYVNNNLSPNNSVSAYSVGADCSLTLINTFPTGGTGGLGIIGTNLAEVCGNNLYAANLVSSTITVFSINPATGVLTAVGSPVPVPGSDNMNFSCSPDGRFLYVARGGSLTISVFSRAADGSLTFVQEVPSGVLSDIKVSPNGSFLLGTESSRRTVVSFTINQADGTLTLGSLVSTGLTPLEIEINCASTLAFVGTTFGVHVFNIGAGGTLTEVLGSPFSTLDGPDLNVQLSPDERFLFVSHLGSNSVSVMSVGATGTLTEITGSPFANTGGVFPQAAVTNATGTCLFALNRDVGATAFSIAADGSLARVGAPTGGSSLTGGIAAYPAAACPEADLSVSKSVSSTGGVGSTAAYEITITNQGPAIAANVVVQDIIPPGTSFVAGSCMTLIDGSAAGTCQVIGDNLTANFPSLTVGQTATVKYTVIITPLGGQLGIITNAVSVSSDNPDPDPNNNTTSVPLQVFDICLQDDTNSSTVFVGNSATGDYRFCCEGVVFTGTARVTRKGSVVTFEHNTADRRVAAKMDRSVFRGSASVQSPPGSLRCTITDRNVRNNTCQCAPACDSASRR